MDAGGGALVGDALHFCDRTERRILAARLRRVTSAASAPGADRERSQARAEVRALFFKALATLLPDLLPGDELAEAVAEFCEAEAGGYSSWR